MLTTLDKLLTHLGEEGNEGELLPLLSAASTAIEERCRRSFGYGNYTELADGLPGIYLTLKNYPVHTIEAVDRENRPLEGIVALERGILFRKEGWPKGECAVTMQYTAGYNLPGAVRVEGVPDLPETLEFACILLVKHLMKEPGVQQERVGDISVTYETGDRPFPSVVEALIAPHIRQLS